VLGAQQNAAGFDILPKCGKVSRAGSFCQQCQKNYSADVKIPVSMSQPLSLSDCYALSLRQSEIIAINADLIKTADARFLQALSIMLPHASFSSLDTKEKTPQDEDIDYETVASSESSTRNFNVKQTLFSGFRAFAAIKGSKFDKSQRIDEKIRAEQLLLVDVADAFYLVIEAREDLRALIRIQTALKDRINELRSRERLGRSRPSEIVNAKAQLYTVESNIEVVANQEVLSRQLLEFLVGQPIQDIVDPYDIPPTMMPEEYYVMKSDSRPDVLAAKYASMVALQESRIVDSDFLPTASIEANYYVQRTGFYKGVDWDVMLTVDVPIFDGGYTLGRSKEYALKADQKDLEFKRARRKAPYDIKTAYARLKTALAIHNSLRKAYTTAKLNYHLQRKDYERSLVNNLDVLASIQTLQDAQRNYIHALYEAKRLYWQLRVAVGEGITEKLDDII